MSAGAAFMLGMTLLASPVMAQDRPLTTLMRPQPLSRTDALSRQSRLFGEDPLANVDALAGTGSLSNRPPATRRTDAAGKPGGTATACDPRTSAGRRPAFGVATGGSGPGEYGRFVDGGRGTATKPPAGTARATSTVPADRPLYGGTGRPLWRDGAPAKPATTARNDAAAEESPGSTIDPVPTPGVDRPLWTDAGGTRAAADPCEERAAGIPGASTQTLFFGRGSTR